MRDGKIGEVPLDAETLQRLLHYDPETGVFTRLIRTSFRINTGEIAGTVKNKGYIVISVCAKYYYAHRLAFLYMTGKWPDRHIDHVDLDGTNNAWRNLRPATRSQNNSNVSLRRDNRTGVKGVRYIRGKWQAAIRSRGERHHLGTFKTINEAADAYAAACARLHGEFGRASVGERQ